MQDSDLQALEAKIDQLIALCENLAQENQALLANQANWAKERAQLREKNEQARSRVEAMISRLKSLEQET